MGSFTARYGGIMQSSIGASSTKALNAAGSYGAFQFRTSGAVTLATVKLYVTTKTGSPVAADLQLEIWSDAAGTAKPSANLANLTSPGSITNNAWNTWTHAGYSLSANTNYWIVFRNVNATPASNYYTVRTPGSGPSIPEPTTPFSGQNYSTSADSGASWSTAAGIYYSMCDALDNGGNSLFCPVEIINANDTTYTVYSTNELGIKFTAPSVGLKIIGCAMTIYSQSTASTARFKLYSGSSPSLVATTDDTRSIGSGSYVTVSALFPSEIILTAGTIYRLTMLQATGTSDSTHYICFANSIQIPNTAAAKAKKPFLGTATLTYYNGSTWADVDTQFSWIEFFLSENEFSNTTAPATTDVRHGVTYVISDANQTGTAYIPTPANVRTGIDVDATTGTCAVPAPSHVRSGTAIDATTGTCAVPAANHVRSGTAIDATTGTLDLPAESNVKTGVTFDGTTKTGTYDGSDRWTDPGQTNVRNGTAYKANSTTNNKTGSAYIPTAANTRFGVNVDATTGTLDLPAVADVKAGVQFDNLTKTGTFSGGVSLEEVQTELASTTENIQTALDAQKADILASVVTTSKLLALK